MRSSSKSAEPKSASSIVIATSFPDVRSRSQSDHVPRMRARVQEQLIRTKCGQAGADLPGEPLDLLGIRMVAVERPQRSVERLHFLPSHEGENGIESLEPALDRLTLPGA